MKEIIKYSSILFVICLVAGVFLGGVYSVAQPRIESTRQEQEDEAVKEVMPGAAKIQKEEKGSLVYYAATDNSGKPLGYVFICEGKGYSSVIRSVVSTDPEGQIIAVKILEQNETPGLGTKITGEEYLDGLKGKTMQDRLDTISGATISSGALTESISNTLKRFFK